MTTIFKRLCRHNFSRVKSKGDFHCGTLSKGHQSLWHSFKVPIGNIIMNHGNIIQILSLWHSTNGSFGGKGGVVEEVGEGRLH